MEKGKKGMKEEEGKEKDTKREMIGLLERTDTHN